MGAEMSAFSEYAELLSRTIASQIGLPHSMENMPKPSSNAMAGHWLSLDAKQYTKTLSNGWEAVDPIDKDFMSGSGDDGNQGNCIKGDS